MFVCVYDIEGHARAGGGTISKQAWRMARSQQVAQRDPTRPGPARPGLAQTQPGRTDCGALAPTRDAGCGALGRLPENATGHWRACPPAHEPPPPPTLHSDCLLGGGTLPSRAGCSGGRRPARSGRCRRGTCCRSGTARVTAPFAHLACGQAAGAAGRSTVRPDDSVRRMAHAAGIPGPGAKAGGREQAARRRGEATTPGRGGVSHGEAADGGPSARRRVGDSSRAGRIQCKTDGLYAH